MMCEVVKARNLGNTVNNKSAIKEIIKIDNQRSGLSGDHFLSTAVHEDYSSVIYFNCFKI